MPEFVTSKENEAVIRAICEYYLLDTDDDLKFDSIMDLADYRRVDSPMLVEMGLYTDSDDAKSAIEKLAEEEFLARECPSEFAYYTTLKIFQYASLMIPPIVKSDELKKRNAKKLKNKEEESINSA